jgi:hypothetical protein
MTVMRMQQSLADIEDAFAVRAREDRERRAELVVQAEVRAHRRNLRRAHRHGSFRFVVVLLTLIATAAIVTFVMFQTLYAVMG